MCGHAEVLAASYSASGLFLANFFRSKRGAFPLTGWFNAIDSKGLKVEGREQSPRPARCRQSPWRIVEVDGHLRPFFGHLQGHLQGHRAPKRVSDSRIFLVNDCFYWCG